MDNQAQINLSIVVPCYNEEKNIPMIFQRFHDALQRYGRSDVEIVLVDNGSTDGSAAVLKQQLEKYNLPAFKQHRIEVNQGYGHGILEGLRVAIGECLAWTHADMQTDPYDVFRAFELYIKSRNHGCEVIIKGRRIKRRFDEWGFTLGMSIISSILLGTLLFDINAQPKMFSRKLFNGLKNPPHDFSLDLFLLYEAKRHNIPIKTIEVEFKKRIYGASKWAFSFRSKIKTITRSIDYILNLRRRVGELS